MDYIRGALSIPSYILSSVRPTQTAEPLLSEKARPDLLLTWIILKRHGSATLRAMTVRHIRMQMRSAMRRETDVRP